MVTPLRDRYPRQFWPLQSSKETNHYHWKHASWFAKHLKRNTRWSCCFSFYKRPSEMWLCECTAGAAVMEKLPPQISHRKQVIMATFQAKSPTVVAFIYSHNIKFLLLGSFCGEEKVNMCVLANITVQSKLGFAICSRETPTSRVFTIKHYQGTSSST